MRIKQQLVILLCGLLVFAAFPIGTLADGDASSSDSGAYSSKDEVIYGKLDANGNLKNMYVVNSFQISEHGEITDYGHYDSVRNLTDLTDIEQKGANKTIIQAENEEFYYQGELQNKPLPWDVAITYLLDGEEINPDELAGKSGKLEIQLTTSANDSVDPIFFEYYLLQISLTVDPLIFEDLQAPEGTEANEGKNKQITFTVMPEQEEEFIISANVRDLEMDPIEIAATPANIGIDSPDVSEMKDEMQTLADAIRDIHSGVGDFQSGIADLNKGARDLSNGSSEYRNGMNELDQSSSELVGGSEQIHSGLNEINAALQNSQEMPDLTELKSVPEDFRNLAEHLRGFISDLGELEKMMEGIKTIDTEPIDRFVEENDANQEVLDTVNQLKQTYSIALGMKELNEQVLNDLIGILENMAGKLDDLATELDAAMGSLDMLDDFVELQEGISQLATQYNEFHNGLITFTDGVHELAVNYAEIDDGTSELANGTADLKDGINDLHEGTQELHDETSDLPSQMQSEIDEFMEDFDYSGFEPTSFVSDKNDNIDVVQFVLQTEAIELEEEEDDDELEEEPKSLWEKFLDLFR